jgi:hypothetical protein
VNLINVFYSINIKIKLYENNINPLFLYCLIIFNSTSIQSLYNSLFITPLKNLKLIILISDNVKILKYIIKINNKSKL